MTVATDARAELADLRRRVRRDAASVVDDARQLIERVDGWEITRWTDGKDAAGDWLEQLTRGERARLFSRWIRPDVRNLAEDVAERIREALPGLRNVSDDEVLSRVWLRATRLIDAGGAVMQGKFPSFHRYSGEIAVRDFAPTVEADGYDVAVLMGTDDAALEHIAAVEAGRSVDDAYRMLGGAVWPRLGPAPYRMDPYAWEHEVRRLLAGLRGDDELELSATDARARLDELVPTFLDDGGSFTAVHAAIVACARDAGLTVGWSEPVTDTVVRMVRVAGRKRGPAPTAPHGSVSAYKRHVRNGETPCKACAEAWARYHRERYARLKSVS